MGLFIDAYEAISPVNGLSKQIEGKPVLSEQGYYECAQVNYADYIDPKISRRMGKVIKMGVACAKKCLDETIPDAIVAGTGLGCVKDTASFLNQLIDRNEELLSPTAFIQSTHNTVAGQVALMLQCRNQNFTFSQKNISFESALLDVMMAMDAGEMKHALLMGVDEITPDSYGLLLKTDCPKSSKNRNGYIPGEGCAAFSVTSAATNKSICEIKNVIVEREVSSLDELLANHGIEIQPEDLLLTDHHMLSTDTVQSAYNYKQLCGEYDTAASFGLFFAALLLDKGINNVEGLSTDIEPETIWLYQKYKDGNCSLIQLKKC